MHDLFGPDLEQIQERIESSFKPLFLYRKEKDGCYIATNDPLTAEEISKVVFYCVVSPIVLRPSN